MIYILVFIILFIGVYKFDIKNGVDKGNRWLFLEWLSLILLAGLRYKIGGDTLTYMDLYSDMDAVYELRHYSIYDSNYGFLWYALVALCQKISYNFTVFQLVHAVIVNSVFFNFFRKHTNKYYTVILFYAIISFLNFNTEILRASLAISVFIAFGYDALLLKKWSKFLFFSLISFGFHNQSFFLVIAPLSFFVGRLRVNLITLVIVIGVSFAMAEIIRILPVIGDFLSYSEIMMSRFDKFSVERELNVFGYLLYLLNISPIAISLYMRKENKKTQEEILIRGAMILYVFLYILSIHYSVIFGRGADFYKPIIILSMAQTVYYHSDYLLRRLMVLLIVFSSFFQYRGDDWIRYYPYSSVLDPHENVERENYMYNYKRK